MNGKQTKKLRQMMRRKYGQDLRDLAEANGKFLRPKPHWMPMWLYIRLLSIFIKIK